MKTNQYSLSTPDNNSFCPVSIWKFNHDQAVNIQMDDDEIPNLVAVSGMKANQCSLCTPVHVVDWESLCPVWMPWNNHDQAVKIQMAVDELLCPVHWNDDQDDDDEIPDLVAVPEMEEAKIRHSHIMEDCMESLLLLKASQLRQYPMSGETIK